MVLPANPAIERDRFVGACTAQCVAGSGDAPTCTVFCDCVASSMDDTGFWDVRGGDPQMGSLVATAAAGCRGGGPLPD